MACVGQTAHADIDFCVCPLQVQWLHERAPPPLPASKTPISRETSSTQFFGTSSFFLFFFVKEAKKREKNVAGV